MTDLARWTFDMAARRDAFAPLGAATIGVVSGLGPCALARGAALAALTDGVRIRRAIAALASYAAGASAGYVAYAAVASFAFRAAAWSSCSYAALSLVLCAVGVRGLVRRSDHRERHGGGSPGTAGSALLLGVGGSIVLSPCCTPFVFALIACATGDARYAAWLLLCFACGHIAPASALAVGARIGTRIRGLAPDSISFASATISLAMAVYFGLLV
jgi:hypothetical protein